MPKLGTSSLCSVAIPLNRRSISQAIRIECITRLVLTFNGYKPCGYHVLVPRNLIGSSIFQPGNPRNRSKATRPSPSCGWGLGTRLSHAGRVVWCSHTLSFGRVSGLRSIVDLIVVHCTQKLGYPIRLLEIYVTSHYSGMCEVSTGKQVHLRAAWCHGNTSYDYELL